MKKSDNERDVLTLAGDAIRQFFVDNDFSSFAHLLNANAIMALKNGGLILGNENIEKILKMSTYFRCKIENEAVDIKKTDNGLYFVSYSVDLSSDDFSGLRSLQANLIVNVENGFDIMFISFADVLSYEKLGNIFPVEKKHVRRRVSAAREELLIKYLKEGLGNKEIASRFSLAEISIKKALAKIYRRFDVKNRGELLEKLEKSGL